MTIDLETLTNEAQAAAGNWQRFESFAWHDKPDHPEDWVIYYTSHRDSGLLAKSNEVQIDEIFESYLDLDPELVREEYHNHWAVGYTQGYAIRVYDPNTRQITEPFKKLCEIQDSLEDYPILNEEHYSEQELEATLENLEQVAWRYDKTDWPKDWVSDLYSYFSEHDSRAIENGSDDQGGWPSDEHLAAAIEGLGWRVEI